VSAPSVDRSAVGPLAIWVEAVSVVVTGSPDWLRARDPLSTAFDQTAFDQAGGLAAHSATGALERSKS
jgi:hypothetical protein